MLRWDIAPHSIDSRYERGQSQVYFEGNARRTYRCSSQLQHSLYEAHIQDHLSQTIRSRREGAAKAQVQLLGKPRENDEAPRHLTHARRLELTRLTLTSLYGRLIKS